MSTFADSSALVKLYADEDGNAAVRALNTLAVSALARVEVPAALWHKHRQGDLGAEEAAILTRAFEADFHGSEGEGPRFAAVAVSAPVLVEAAELTAVHPLRACDAVELGCALAARAADPRCDRFACFDEGLRRVAAARGFALVP